MMNQTTQNILLILLLITSVLLAPAFMGGSIIDSFAEEDDLGDRDEFALIGTFSVLWIRIPVHQMSVLFGLGISIFALFGVYVGGRSKRNLFNDRTIDAFNVLKAYLLKTAHIRAVFNFNSLTISTGGYAYFMQIIKALISCLTLLMGSPVHGMRIFVPARMPSTVHSRPIFIRRVKL
jgi:hypothetical protein